MEKELKHELTSKQLLTAKQLSAEGTITNSMLSANWQHPKLNLKFTRIRDVKAPVRGTDVAAGVDFFVPNGFKDTVLCPNDRICIPSGIYVKLPNPSDIGYGGMGIAFIAHNKSGVSVKKGLQFSAGVIDEDYQGELGIVIVNTSNDEVEIKAGEKIVQFILTPVFYPTLEEVPFSELHCVDSDRGANGFGSTGSF